MPFTNLLNWLAMEQPHLHKYFHLNEFIFLTQGKRNKCHKRTDTQGFETEGNLMKQANRWQKNVGPLESDFAARTAGLKAWLL